jgi:hypothetical protein
VDRGIASSEEAERRDHGEVKHEGLTRKRSTQ